MPKRIQRKRTKGWRMPIGTIYVGRPSIFCNRWKIGTYSKFIGGIIKTKSEAVLCYKNLENNTPFMKNFIREKLRGKDLACWCSLTEPCHADVLLEIANAEKSETDSIT